MSYDCAACRQPLSGFGNATILNKYQVAYFRCSSCGFITTEKPYWLAEAYAEPIAREDIGLVSRNLHISSAVDGIIKAFFRDGRAFLDYGGGTGLFVRLMRDQGHEFYWYDQHAKNMFAMGFEVDRPFTQRFDLVTAVEVMEHLERPDSFLEEVFSWTDSLLFTTELVPASVPKPGEWWYYALEAGQHISLFTRKSLNCLAAAYGLQLHTCGGIHLLTRRHLSERAFHLVFHPLAGRLLRRYYAKPSLLTRDYEALTGKRLC
jgi:hypothetical protein